ncbi:RNA polymerase sigma factor [Sphingobacterium wenxiniae]|uniref:RNA polymerase sigma-70 factor, ECF subfamily n=1 Tax=Sphingobacterium wenxiniae TaxID=683125 RepID=A0A1I6STS4_9SPHI|nr:RNA polymerase sigma-70 factor [Sphingobacterium wenxiniae]SFS80334.1 RNA polymerase sigma-70 factor, ECF subfamily [Sphingobacterium wenxiniae]
MEEIWLKLRKGDTEAFRVFFYSHKDAIYKYAFLHLKDEELAADIVQEVFLKFWNKVKSIDPHQNIRAYLYTITKHTVLEELRKKALFSNFINHTQYQHTEGSNSNEEQQAFQELQTIYHQAISSLPEKRKEIYQLSKLENRSNQEIAEHLSISPNTVRDQLVKAHKSVKTYILSMSNYILPLLLIIKKIFF